MKIKNTCFFVLFAFSLHLSALKIQPIGEFTKPLKIYSLAQLKAFAAIDKSKVRKITANPFPLENTQDVLSFSCLCPLWSTWNVFSDEEFYEGNCNWIQYTSYIKKINL